MLRILAGGSADSDVLVATAGEVVIGHAMAGDRTGPGGGVLTEIGVVVADGYRGRGVGSALVRRLVARARRRGATAVIMEVLAENRQVLTMIEDHWPVASQDHAGAYITIRAGLPAEVVWPAPEPAGGGSPAARIPAGTVAAARVPRLNGADPGRDDRVVPLPVHRRDHAGFTPRSR